MKMPNGEKAVVPESKLVDYLLNTEHPVQPGHAELFERLLGLTREDAPDLKAALEDAAANAEAVEGSPSPFGKKYEVEFPMSGPREPILFSVSGSLRTVLMLPDG